MKIEIVTPAAPGSIGGNRVTALRWAKLLRSLSHHVVVRQRLEQSTDADVLVAVHATKSAASVFAFRQRYPDRPVIVGVAGTDLYGSASAEAELIFERVLAAATRIVVLQPDSVADLPADATAKVVAIEQSCPTPQFAKQAADTFEVCVVGNLRAIKDPLLAAEASALLPPDSRVSVRHIGAARDDRLATQAQRCAVQNPRYRWVGPHKRQRTLQAIARARLLVLTSRAEGGANVVSEAIACGTPVLSTAIAGSTGLLGADYPGLFAVGDAAGLSVLLRRAETDPAFMRSLAQRCAEVRPRFSPQRERAAWQRLLADVAPPALP